MKFGVIKFPGSNCDQDAYYTIKDILGQSVEYLWHQDCDVKNVDCVVVPGGFSYGDYLRCGAIARFSPVMEAVIDHANNGGFVIGICNGFQVLCESHLLPGALVRNDNQKFICKQVHLKAENVNTPWTELIQSDAVVQIPIAHGEGKFVCDDATYDTLSHENRILFRYTDSDGNTTRIANPNGSRDNIAGIANQAYNVLGLMPHPERASDSALGSSDGRIIFDSLIKHFQ